MNPCPSARPGEGEQEQNRRGSLSARSGRDSRESGRTEDWGRPILFLLGVPGQSPRTPANKQSAAQRLHCLRKGWKPHGRDPESRLRDLKGLGSRQPGPCHALARDRDALRKNAVRMPAAYRYNAGHQRHYRGAATGISQKGLGNGYSQLIGKFGDIIDDLLRERNFSASVIPPCRIRAIAGDAYWLGRVDRRALSDKFNVFSRLSCHVLQAGVVFRIPNHQHYGILTFG